MHGMVFGELKKFVDKNIGGDSWQALIKKLDLRKVYIPIQEYPDEEILSLVGEASKITGISIYDLLVLFGKFIASTLLQSYHRQITSTWTLMDLLENTESTIHKVVRLRNPSARPPKLQIRRINENKVIITYSSPRKLCGFAIGIAKGVAEKFDEEIDIKEEHCMLKGDLVCEIEIQRLNVEQPAVTFSNLNLSQSVPEITTPPISKNKKIIHSNNAPIIIAGTGPVGIQAAREILKHAPQHPLVIYGAEPWEAYNRVHLSELLAGDLEWEQIVNTLNISSDNLISMHINAPIIEIDSKNKVIIDAKGQPQVYSSLILAVGSYARRVDLGNRSLLGIHTYRDIDDAQKLMTHVIQSERTVILGGGILGMEVAFALKAQNSEADVIILHRHERLMNRELDAEASAFLLMQVETLGIKVIFNTFISTYLGENELTGIQLKEGNILPCDTLVVCIGIEPNIRLAKESGLETNKGIKVNNFMQTSDENIYAIGECVEHNEITYGLLGPGLEQAVIAVDNILSSHPKSEYHGTPLSIRAKIKHLPVCTVENSKKNYNYAELNTWVFKDTKQNQFKKLYFHHGKLVKATGIGHWSEFNLIQQAIEEGLQPNIWHHYRFLKTGTLWAKSQQNPLDWPNQSIVCTCCSVTRGKIGEAVALGHTSLELISEQTGAMQGCGSCKDIVALLAGKAGDNKNVIRNHKVLLINSLIPLLLMLSVFFMGVAVPNSVEEQGFLSLLLFDNFWQQVSGYTTIGLVILSLPLLINKRLKMLSFSSYDTWRIVHVIVITLSTLSFLIHSNFGLGDNFNFQVMFIFLITLVSGTFISLFIYLEHSIFDFILVKLYPIWVRLHIFLVSIFFVFIAVHVTTVYYF